MMLQTIVLAILVPVFLAAAIYVFDRRTDRLEGQLEEFRKEALRKLDLVATKADLESAKTDLGDRIGRVEGEVGGFRSDLTHIALAVGARTRPQTG
jgi:hypothetical protein